MSASEEIPPPSSWSTVARAQNLAFVLARHGFGEVASRVGFGALLERARSGPPSASASRGRLGKRLAAVLSDLGPTYVKLGQMLATREDLLPPEITSSLAELHASVPPMSRRKVARAVEVAMGAPPERAFAWFEREPLAAASIGQVHRARTKHGEEVVVKVQRPGLRKAVRGDLALMRLVAEQLAQRIPEVAAYDPLGLLAAFERSLLRELDFRVEAENARELGRALAGAPEVRVPRIVHACETLLVMERIEGRRLAGLEGTARPLARAALLRAFVRQVLEHGVFHADPHPGNVLVEAPGRVVLLDLGAVERLDGATRGKLLRLVLALALRRRRALASAVVSLSVSNGAAPIDAPRLESDVTALVLAASPGASAARMAERMIAVSRTHGLRMPPALLGLARALAILDGVLRSLEPSADVVRDLRLEACRAAARIAWVRILFAWRAAWALIVAVLAWPARQARQARAARPSLSDE
jgi:ubiquinone biosynthesis protein